MAANFTEIKARLEYYCDETIPATTAIQMFNQCNEDIAAISGYAVEGASSFSTATPSWTPLPADFFEMQELQLMLASKTEYIRVRPLGLAQDSTYESSQVPYQDDAIGYRIFGDNMEFVPNLTENASLKLRYYGYLPTISQLSDTPKLKPRFHDMYALFGAAKYFQNYMDELTAKVDYWNEYLGKRRELEQEFNRLRTRSRSKTVFVYRSWY